MPFLAVNGGHGAIITQGRMQSGIQISLEKLNGVSIAKDGKTATFGGGILSKRVTDELWKSNKQTVTGLCECTSLLGPGLGGGHGILQGRHGLVADQFVSMNVVNADGKMVKVDAKSDPDLWWALKGAGHNFGIVTSVTSKIYDVNHRNWAWRYYIFSGDKVEKLYALINDHLLKNGTQRVDLQNYSFFFNQPAIDPDNAVVIFYMLQEDATVIDQDAVQPFLDLKPITTEAGTSEYPGMPSALGNGNDAATCKDAGLSNIRFPVGLQTYDPKAQKRVFDLFSEGTHHNTALNNSIFLFEGYSNQGVKAVDGPSTAFAHRDDELLAAPLMIYQGAGPELDQQAVDLGKKLRDTLQTASHQRELHSYVNYAYGDETLRNMYGYEMWRQMKLKMLKTEHDPEGRFNFYAPIA